MSVWQLARITAKTGDDFDLAHSLLSIVVTRFKRALMAIADICPFYGKNDDYCDVGCGYISTHDVNMIIRYCSGRHAECVKYLELADRFPRELDSLVKC